MGIKKNHPGPSRTRHRDELQRFEKRLFFFSVNRDLLGFFFPYSSYICRSGYLIRPDFGNINVRICRRVWIRVNIGHPYICWFRILRRIGWWHRRSDRRSELRLPSRRNFFGFFGFHPINRCNFWLRWATTVKYLFLEASKLALFEFWVKSWKLSNFAPLYPKLVLNF